MTLGVPVPRNTPSALAAVEPHCAVERVLALDTPMFRNARSSPSLPRWVVGLGLCVGVNHACATQAFGDAMMQTPSVASLSWVEATTVQANPDDPLLVELQGEVSAEHVLQLEQNGFILFEQQFPLGRFHVHDVLPLRSDIPLTVRLQSPDQTDVHTELPLRPLARRQIFSKRSDLLALAPATTPKPLETKPNRSPLEDDIEFDMDFLRGKAFRNLSPLEIKRLGKVRPGNMDAEVYRNGVLVSKSNVLFVLPPDGDEARACISSDLFQKLGVKPNFISPQGLQLIRVADKPSTTGPTDTTLPRCLFIEDWVTGASSAFDSSDLRLELTVAQAFLTRQTRQSVPADMLTRGENAGFINYALNNYSTQNFNSHFLSLNSGLNVEGWQLRHTSYLSQSRSNSQNNSQYVNGETVIKRPLVDLKAHLALGNIASNSPIIGSTPLQGVRLGSEEGLLPDEEKSYRPVIRGVARTNARVRVSQNKVVFFEQTVPPGPFEFDDINPVSSVGDLQVVIAEADGSQQSFVVPYSQTAGKLKPGAYLYNIAAGVYRNASAVQQKPSVLQTYVRFGLNDFLTPGVEVLLAPNYSNAGIQAGFNTAMGSVSVNSLFSRFTTSDQITTKGSAQNLIYGSPRWDRIQLSAGVANQSRTYTTPSTGLTGGAATLFANDSFKSNRFIGLGVSLNQWGGVNVSASQQRTWQNAITQQLRLGYANNLGLINFSVNLDHATSSSALAPSNTFSLTASIPLSLASTQGGVSASYSQKDHDPGSTSLGFYGNNPAYPLNYNLSKSQTGDFGTSSASASLQHRYGNIGASLSSSTGGGQQTGLSASGSVVAHSGGLLLAPMVGDTFAIVEVPQGEGAGLLGSTARINSGGFGVLPYLSPYYLNDVQISLEGASAELEVANVSQSVAPVDGSIVRLKFNATSGRPLLIVLQASNGARIPIGATVTNSQGIDVGTVGQGSRALVRVSAVKDELTVVWGEGPEESCKLVYTLDGIPTASANGFTHLKLRCEVASAAEKTAQTLTQGG